MKHASITVSIVLTSLISLVVPALALAQGVQSLTMGSSVSPALGERTIVIGPDTRWVNVNQNEQIRFVADGVEFGWRFDAPGARSFDLQQVAPAGALKRPVSVYITRISGRPG